MSIETTTRPFDHQQGGDYPGSRGIVLDTVRPHSSGLVLSANFPSVFIADTGFVDMDDGRYPADDMLAWLEAVASTIRQHTHEQI